jgi:hypothetical protein
MTRESSKETVRTAQDLIDITNIEIDDMTPEQRQELKTKIRSLAASVLSQADPED